MCGADGGAKRARAAIIRGAGNGEAGNLRLNAVTAKNFEQAEESELEREEFCFHVSRLGSYFLWY